MVYGRSLSLCRMIVVICILFLCPGILKALQAKKRLEKVLIKKEREREIGDRTLMLKRHSPVILS